MSTFDFLLDHAYTNVWCAPGQDFQVILAPKKISAKNGARSSIKILWSTYNLPDKTSWWHVYQIGEITPQLIGLSDRQMQWISVQEHCNSEYLIADLYVNAGMQFPRYTSYLLHTRDGNLILAVKRFNEIADLNDQPLFLRLYSNAYFSGEALDDSQEGIEVRGTRIESTEQRSLYLAKWRERKAARGHVYAFKNGYRIADLNTSTVQVGDTVEYVWDSSIKRVVELPIKSMTSFASSLDRKQKFLLHYPEHTDVIDYRDDIDVFLIRRETAAIFKGVYYHKNQEDALRMVTHKDYSMPVPYVVGYLAGMPEWTNILELQVILHIRKAGYERPLVDEHHRIKELYKLSESDVIMAMVGTESTVPEWQAAALEASQYPAIMRSVKEQITGEMIQDAYGYNAISKLIADTPQVRKTASEVFELPVGLHTDATVYEYDSNGVLLDWYGHYAGRYYIPRNAACRYIEGIVGLGDTSLSTVYNQPSTALTDGISYRMYVCGLWNGEPDGVWKDVTGNSDYYDVINEVLVWKVDQSKFYTAIKNDKDFLAYDLNLDYRDGILRFTINVDEVRTDGVEYMGKAEIPFGRFDLWLNGRPIIEDLDYFVEWPEICIVNKEYLVPGKLQRISIRGTGFCKDDMTRDKPSDKGFIDHGLLSHNNRYDIRDDKVMRIVVDGALMTREALSFSENDTGVRITQARNGAPYLVSDMIVPLRNLVREDTYVLRQKSLEVDTRISDYMTLKLPEPDFEYPNAIPRLYAIFSPFVSKIMYDLIYGLIDTSDLQGQYSDVLVKEKLVQHEWLLKYEPTRRNIDRRYVSIHPHDLSTEVTLTIYQYRFLLRVIRLYLDDKVDITRFIRIEAGYEYEVPA